MWNKIKHKDYFNFSKTAFFALLITLFISGLYQSSVSASGYLGENDKYLRFIKTDYLDTLSLNSKWRFGALHNLLRDTLEDDLTDSSSCEQVWHFSADEYEQAREWCLKARKGSITNLKFITEFHAERLY